MRDKRTCHARVRSPIYIFLCTVLVTLRRLGQISYHFDDSRTLHYTRITYLYTRWSTFPDRFHTVSFTMQSHDQNSTLSLKVNHHFIPVTLYPSLLTITYKWTLLTYCPLDVSMMDSNLSCRVDISWPLYSHVQPRSYLIQLTPNSSPLRVSLVSS